MLADQLSWQARLRRTLTACAILAALLGPAGVGQAQARPAPGVKQVSFLGYTFRVPRSWPVINDADHPRGCVRFDVHAVYLGTPGVNQACPSWLLGTTEAVLIQPGPARAARVSRENPVAHDITVTAPRISLTATFDASPTQIYRILASASLPAPVITVPNPARLDAARPPGRRSAGSARRVRRSTTAPRAARPSARPAVRAAGVADYRGRGFDSCATPSAAYMRAWRRWSPYRAVGIFIGGADQACDQRNLTPGWVAHQARAGWRFIPMYAGPQAAFGQLTSPGRQGASAAADAVTQAEHLGFGRRTPLYYDMEAYPGREAGPALRFLSAWTTALHQLGYASGVYGSSQSGIADLAQQYSRHAYAMPDVIDDALWNGVANTADMTFRPGEWVNHRRIHQYSGNVTQTYGHDRIDIDQDYLNVELPGPAGPAAAGQASPAVPVPGGGVEVFYQGPGRRLWRQAYSAGQGWSRPAGMGVRIRSAPSAVPAGGGLLDVFYQGADRRLWEVSFRPGHGWTRARRLPRMRILGGAPQAVAQSGGVIDVFWRGTPGARLWLARFIPGDGWTGPRLLGGSLASDPSPAQTSSGVIEVFWTGSDRSLWSVAGRGDSWSRPVRLGTAPAGGPAHAIGQAGSSAEVFWRGTGRPHVWAASAAPGRLAVPVDLGGNVAGSPRPVMVAGQLRVLWQAPGGALWEEQRAPRGGWSGPVMLQAGGRPGAGLYAAAGSAGGRLWVFWRGAAGRLRPVLAASY